MPRLYTNTDCPLHGSEYCARLHMESCDTCTVRGRDEEEMQLLKQDLDAIAAMMPEEGIAALFLTNECVLCKGEEKGARLVCANRHWKCGAKAQAVGLSRHQAGGACRVHPADSTCLL